MSQTRYLKAVRRIGCFLYSIGIRPTLDQKTNRERFRALIEVYSTLPLDLRREARRRGRKVIKALGLKSASANLFQSRPSAPQSGFGQRECDARLNKLLRQSLGHCRHCQAWGRPKRAWPSRELADAFRPFAGDMTLEVYECPIVRGSYHLGHIRKPTPSTTPTTNATND